MHATITFLFSLLLMYIPVDSSQNGPTVEGVPEKQNACEIFTKEEVAALLEVPVSSLTVEDMWSNEKRSVCYYYSSESSRKLYIRLAWKSAKAIQNKVLENKYKKYLSQGENGLMYSELDGATDQVLLGKGEDRGGQKMLVIRKRYGNEAEAQIEMVDADREEFADTLRQWLSRI